MPFMNYAENTFPTSIKLFPSNTALDGKRNISKMVIIKSRKVDT